jgi:hypothetical protein
MKFYDRMDTAAIFFARGHKPMGALDPGPTLSEGAGANHRLRDGLQSDRNPLFLLGLYGDAYLRVDGVLLILRSRLGLFWAGAE